MARIGAEDPRLVARLRRLAHGVGSSARQATHGASHGAWGPGPRTQSLLPRRKTGTRAPPSPLVVLRCGTPALLCVSTPSRRRALARRSRPRGRDHVGPRHAGEGRLRDRRDPAARACARDHARLHHPQGPARPTAGELRRRAGADVDDRRRRGADLRDGRRRELQRRLGRARTADFAAGRAQAALPRRRI